MTSIRNACDCRSIALLATALLQACAAEVGVETDEGDETSAVEGSSQTLTTPKTQFAAWLDDADRPFDEEYVPPANYRLNVKSIVRLETGFYRIIPDSPTKLDVPDLVQVTAYGSDNTRCKSDIVGDATRITTWDVVCHDASGARADSRFVYSAFMMAGIQGKAAGGLFFGTAGVMVSSFSTLLGTVTGKRNGVGDYTMSMTRVASTSRGGTVQVTADQGVTDDTYCKAVAWSPDPNTPTTMNIQVRCFRSGVDELGSSKRADVSFYFLYDLDIPTRFNRGAYAWANDATSPSYQPNPFYTFMTGPEFGQSSTSATGSLLKKPDGTEDTGHYKMVYKGLNEDVPWNAYVFTGAHGPTSEYCKILFWGRPFNCSVDCDIEVHTLCFDSAGKRKNTKYVQTWGSFSTFQIN